MPDWLMRVIRAEAKNLIALAAEDQELRADLRSLAEEILAATADLAAGTEKETTEADARATLEPTESETKDTVEPLRELTLGRSVAAKGESGVATTSASHSGAAHHELAELEARCRWKAEAARWAAERLCRSLEGNECPDLDAATDPKMAEWADKLTDCYYWVSASESSQRADLSLLEDVGGCFESLAEGLATAGHPREEPRVQSSGANSAAHRRGTIGFEGCLEEVGCTGRRGPVGGVRMGQDQRGASPGLPEAVHAVRRPCQSHRLASTSGAHRSHGGERSA